MKKCCRTLCKHAQQGIKHVSPSTKAETRHISKPNSSRTTFSFASRSLFASAPCLTLTTHTHRLVGGHTSLQNADYQRRCFGTNARSRTYYYDVLGVTPKATQAEIKSAYYKLSKVYHPDISKKDESKKMFSEISEAYEVIGNIKKRRMYDHGIYSRNEPPPADDGDYTQSFRQREGFGFERQAPPTGRTSKYNFDEFYRQHYGDAMRQERADREFMRQMEQEMASASMERKMRVLVTVSTIVSLFIMFFMNSNSLPGKKPTQNKSNARKK